MKRIAIVLLLLLISVGCKPKAAPPRNAKQISEDAGYIQGTIEQRDVAREKILEIEARQAVEGFKALQGRLPTSLDELAAPLKNLPRGRVYDYNPETGALNVR